MFMSTNVLDICFQVYYNFFFNKKKIIQRESLERWGFEFSFEVLTGRFNDVN